MGKLLLFKKPDIERRAQLGMAENGGRRFAWCQNRETKTVFLHDFSKETLPKNCTPVIFRKRLFR